MKNRELNHRGTEAQRNTGEENRRGAESQRDNRREESGRNTENSDENTFDLAITDIARSSKWIRVAFPRVIFFQEGPGLRKYQYSDLESDVPFLNIRTFSQDGYIRKDLCGRIRREEFEKKYEHFLCEPGDILLASSGSLGKMAEVTEADLPIMLNTSIIRFRPLQSTHLASRFLWFYLKSEDFRRQYSTAKTGTAISNFGPTHLKAMSIPLPPLAEQERIAARLDLLLGRLKRARSRLDGVPDLIKRFRKSVLNMAVSGRLTEEWREGQSISVDQLKTPDLFPRGWRRGAIGSEGKVQLGRQRAPKFHSGMYMRPYLRVQNVFEDRLDLSDVMEMDFPGEDIAKYELKDGDILLNEGQSPEYLGRPAIYRSELSGACFTNTLIRFQAGENLVPRFALFVFMHYMHSGVFSGKGTITTNIAHLGAGRFAALEMPIPTLTEQQEIARRVDELFAFADALERRVGLARKMAERLEPSILAKAFRGELSKQIPEEAAEWERVLAQVERDAGALAEKVGGARGRKLKAAAPKAEKVSPDAAVPKRRGRPPKVQAVEAVPAAEPLKRGRGRPKKN